MAITTRNKMIVCERKQGMTYVAIAKKHGISIERSRQIFELAMRQERIDEKTKEALAGKNLMDIEIFYFGALSYRARLVLKAERVETIGQLVGLTKNDLLKMPNLGRTTIRQLVEALDRANIKHGF